MSMNDSDASWNPPPTAATPGRSVTRDEVRHVAALASLELTTEEEMRMERDLNAILFYIAELNELDTVNVEPMSQVSEVLGGSGPSAERQSQAALRPDEPRPSLPRSTVMAGAPATDGIFFKVPKVIER
jgi:aspartyl-tRNA(Asn)/glutamyl-tRNA(Gln) amidotransferase subunit C